MKTLYLSSVVLVGILCVGCNGEALLSGRAIEVYGQAERRIRELESSIVERRQIVPDLGTKFDDIMTTAMRGSSYNRILEKTIDAKCEKIFYKQIELLRLDALKKLVALKGNDDYESVHSVDLEFCLAAKRSMRTHADWDYAIERVFLDEVASSYIWHKMRAADVQLEAAKQQASYMKLFSFYNSQIQHLQATQFTRPQIPLAAAFAYRIPGETRDSADINLSGNYQQGKASLQLSKIDDSTVLSASDPATILAPAKGYLGFSFLA
mmetsp:Transcript_12555/g.16902  ORF Transcript_12555/g.16902 Transcript_12555/m.16902 type:complete len:266 (-) Transcript_12555:225-1022(-)